MANEVSEWTVSQVALEVIENRVGADAAEQMRKNKSIQKVDSLKKRQVIGEISRKFGVSIDDVNDDQSPQAALEELTRKINRAKKFQR